MGADTDAASERVVQAVAALTDADSLDLPPLYEVIDPAALDTWVARNAGTTLSFRYAGVAVSVGSDGSVEVRDASTASLRDPVGRGPADRGPDR